MLNFSKYNLSQAIAFILILIACLWIFIGPALMVGPSSTISFKNTGEIGDTIGGITAPVIGLVSAILLYLSFRAQIKANRVVQQEANFRYILDEFENAKAKIESFQFQDTVGLYNGNYGLERLAIEIHSYIQTSVGVWRYDEYFAKANFQMINFSIFLEEVSDLDISDKQRKTIKAKIWFYHAEYMNEMTTTVSFWKLENVILPLNSEPAWSEFKFRILEIRRTMDQFQEAFGD